MACQGEVCDGLETSLHNH